MRGKALPGGKSGLIRILALGPSDHPPDPLQHPPAPNGYGIPGSLRDLLMVDMLELTGTTTAAAAQLGISQSSVSRRYRALARDLDLVHDPGAPIGLRYGNTVWMRKLREGINGHRLARGVLRVGVPMGVWSACRAQPQCQWVGLPAEVIQEWPRLLEEELLDGVVTGHPPELEPTDGLCCCCLPAEWVPLSPPWLISRNDGMVRTVVETICSPIGNRSD